tara:strand:+ start:45 stop:2021 length:1977 start_codon:yes stop_codon:yes gene_type:complete
MYEILKSPSNPDKTYLKDNDGTTHQVIEMESQSTGKVYYQNPTTKKTWEKFEPSFRDYAQQVLGQGTLMGFGDEILGGIQGSYDTLTGKGDWGDNVDKRIDAERARMKKTEQDLGMLKTLALQGGGGLLTGGLGAGKAMVGKGLSMLAKGTRGAKLGAVQGGITGGGMSEGGFTSDGLLQRGKGTVLGAGAGAALGGAFPAVGEAFVQGGKAVGRMLPGGAERQAAGLLRSTIPRSAIPRMEQQTMANPVSVVADFAPVDAKRLVGEATRTIGSGPAVKYLKARQRSQAARIVPTVDDLISPDSLAEKINSLSSQRKLNAQKNYGEFYQNEVKLTPELKSFFERDALKEAYQFAKKLANNENVNLPPLFTRGKDGTKRYVVPNAQLLDYMKQGMDAVVEKSYKESGTLGTSNKILRNNFRDHLDKIMPDYKKARSDYAGTSAAIEAAENGRKFMASLGKQSEDNAMKGFGRKDIANMGEHEQEAFRSGAASILRQKIEGKSFGSNITLMFDSPGFKKDLDALIGKDAAREFRRVIKAEAKMAETFAENQGSATAQRLSAGQTMSTPASAVAASLTPEVAIANKGLQLIDQLSPQPEAVAQNISRLMASPKIADKMLAFQILKSRQITRPISRAADLAVGASSGVGGVLGGISGAKLGQ